MRKRKKKMSRLIRALIVIVDLVRSSQRSTDLVTSACQRRISHPPSPDGCTVASAVGDETLRLWNVFRDPQVAKPAPKAVREPFVHLYRTSIR
ncbi:hypothetical protein Dsin_017914 [Dipteronia sinensis]|uniref:Uncharacterized protein n=1 Tax=Dipteronia sinensis TaxID=43782 RepID=A0AAE0AGV1_9ROSI|nr:hypothetical protein Dsin_017914 [Dipteronia sinensis]